MLGDVLKMHCVQAYYTGNTLRQFAVLLLLLMRVAEVLVVVVVVMVVVVVVVVVVVMVVVVVVGECKMLYLLLSIRFSFNCPSCLRLIGIRKSVAQAFVSFCLHLRLPTQQLQACGHGPFLCTPI